MNVCDATYSELSVQMYIFRNRVDYDSTLYSLLLEVCHFIWRTVFISCLQAGLAIGWQGVAQAGPESLVQHIMTNFECKLFLNAAPRLSTVQIKYAPIIIKFDTKVSLR